MLFYKVIKDLDYENLEVVVVGYMYEMMILVFDDLYLFYIGNYYKLFKVGSCVINIYYIRNEID